MNVHAAYRAITVHHAGDAIERRVREWFSGQPLKRKRLDGNRSIRIPHPEKDGCDLKIKGAGFRGGAIDFTAHHRSGPKQPRFDFEGRMMDDVAAGHDNAYRGGATFQQAVTEYRVSQRLSRLGYEVVPCPGYGRLEAEGRVAWFSLFEWDRSWRDNVVVPHISVEEFAEASIRGGRLFLELASQHDLIGYCWFVNTENGYILKDLHPFIRADPINMSQLTWVMHVIFAIHIRCLAATAYTRIAQSKDVPPDLQAYPFRAVRPETTTAEHERLRYDVIGPYMLTPPEDFSPAKLYATLRTNPISNALLDACPRRFTRYE